MTLGFRLTEFRKQYPNLALVVPKIVESVKDVSFKVSRKLEDITIRSGNWNFSEDQNVRNSLESSFVSRTKCNCTVSALSTIFI